MTTIITASRIRSRTMADKDKAGPSATATAAESLLDFASLPASALDNYITYYDLAKSYPPPPDKRAPSHDSNAAAEEDEREAAAGRRDSRASNRAAAAIEEGHAMTNSRLRPRSPPPTTQSGGGASGSKRNAGAAGLDEHGQSNGAPGADDPDPSPTHFFDVQDADEYLAGVATKHFNAQPQPKEGEVVVQFLYRCRAGNKCLKVAT